ncbi:hypothetical protein CfE428DRAFT_2277 [Chthoniobacter flavus Ellin428]|uniref:Uncharacterized protein n=1 Tax=Chthoniobacter flavus Ellin428 TaxID=497964 RepID=B4D039_9BACT|nr:hypothetical protein [Chthoniobacter flavus]EDY20353.1 hypothetical protein CfE428DRAFT_2277 [Chthoniobacter flavus Ellin428]TCO94246.1 hypothetical protein EV701_103335 [Chthoniobacter flavus]
MNSEPPPLPPKKPLAPAVILAFVPSVLALSLAAIQPSKEKLVACCVIAAMVSIVCCGAASFLLIRRNTTTTIVVGILLGLLNLLISAGLGCAALLSNINVH